MVISVLIFHQESRRFQNIIFRHILVQKGNLKYMFSVVGGTKHGESEPSCCVERLLPSVPLWHTGATIN